MLNRCPASHQRRSASSGEGAAVNLDTAPPVSSTTSEPVAAIPTCVDRSAAPNFELVCFVSYVLAAAFLAAYHLLNSGNSAGGSRTGCMHLA